MRHPALFANQTPGEEREVRGYWLDVKRPGKRLRTIGVRESLPMTSAALAQVYRKQPFLNFLTLNP